MTGVKKESHQKKRMKRPDLNNNNPIVNLNEKFDNAINVNSPIGGAARVLIERVAIELSPIGGAARVPIERVPIGQVPIERVPIGQVPIV